jgi:hypothetical protein
MCRSTVTEGSSPAPLGSKKCPFKSITFGTILPQFQLMFDCLTLNKKNVEGKSAISAGDVLVSATEDLRFQ